MTLAVDDDFGGFVAARWPDLEAVALVAAADPALARELTARALAGVGGRWEDVVEQGAPTRAARAALLREVARPPRSARGRTTPSSLPDTPPPWATADDDAVSRRLVEALGREAPLVRAGVAAGALWECDDTETAALAGIAPGPFAERLDAARDRLLATHREALADDGLSPADWRLERDLVDALGALAAAQPDPPDPAGLVSGRTRRVRRRSLLTGGAALVAAGGVAWWVLRDASAPLSGGEPTPDAPTATSDVDPVWSSTSSWPPRGSLAGDEGVRALVRADGGTAARLLFADDLFGTRVVVAGLFDAPNLVANSTLLAAWTGPAAATPDLMTRVPLTFDRADGVGDVVALSVPTTPGGTFYTTGSVRRAGTAGPAATAVDTVDAVLVVLARPTERGATWSPRVHPTRNGSVERTWTLIGLEDGVGSRPLEQVPGTAARIRVGDYDGPVAGTASPLTTPGERPVEVAAAEYIAAATGLRPSDLRSEVVVDSPVDGSVLDAFAMSVQGGDGRVRVVHTTTPDGALIRTLHVADDGRSGRSSMFGAPFVLPPGAADEPVVRRLDLVPPRTTRYLVVAPGAAECQLLATSPAAYPVSKVVPLKRDTAVVPIDNGQDTGSHRLVLWDERGRRTYSGTPERGRLLLDLWPGF